MDREQTRRIKGLIRRLMAGEAREIYIKDKPKINRTYNQPLKGNMDKIKNELCRFLEENSLVVNPESIKTYALKYLHEQEEIATANPSYKILRQRIERSEYDFSFVNRKSLKNKPQ